MIGNRDYKLKIKKTLLIITIIFSFLFINGCTLPESIQVLDKETKEPIPDVITYYRCEYGHPAGSNIIKVGIIISDKKGRIFLEGVNLPLPGLTGTEARIFAVGYQSAETKSFLVPLKEKRIYLNKLKNDDQYYKTIHETASFCINMYGNEYHHIKPYNINIDREIRNTIRKFVIKMCEDFIKKFPKSKYYNNVLYIMGSVYSDLASGWNYEGRNPAGIYPGENIDYNKTAEIYKEIVNNGRGFYGDTNSYTLQQIKKFVESGFPAQYEEYKRTGKPIKPVWVAY